MCFFHSWGVGVWGIILMKNSITFNIFLLKPSHREGFKNNSIIFMVFSMEGYHLPRTPSVENNECFPHICFQIKCAWFATLQKVTSMGDSRHFEVKNFIDFFSCFRPFRTVWRGLFFLLTIWIKNVLGYDYFTQSSLFIIFIHLFYIHMYY